MGAKENRRVSITKNIYMPISSLDWSKTLVQKVWLKDFGYVLAAKIVFPDEDIQYVVTNDLSLTDIEMLKMDNDRRWNIETFHRGLKQTTGVEKCYSTLEKSQRNHIFASFLAFVKFESTRIKDGIPWHEQKALCQNRGLICAWCAGSRLNRHYYYGHTTALAPRKAPVSCLDAPA